MLSCDEPTLPIPTTFLSQVEALEAPVVSETFMATECVICCEQVTSGSEPNQKKTDSITTGCGHTFHEECIDKWKRYSMALLVDGFRCPTCRADLTEEYARGPAAYGIYEFERLRASRQYPRGLRGRHQPPRPDNVIDTFSVNCALIWQLLNPWSDDVAQAICTARSSNCVM